MLPDFARELHDPVLMGYLAAAAILGFVAYFAGRQHEDVPAPVAWLVIAAGAVMAFIAYSPNLDQPFRSDNYIAYNLFRHLSYNFDDFLRASRFEMFGHRRVHPVAHTIMYLQSRILGMHHERHHLFQFAIHFLNAVLLYLFVNRLVGRRWIAALAAFLFVTSYSHFDMINWTYHSFVVIDCSLTLAAFLCIVSFVNRPRLLPVILAPPLLFVAQLTYEPNAFFSVLAAILVFLLVWLKTVPSDVEQRGTIVSSISTALGAAWNYLLLSLKRPLPQAYKRGLITFGAGFIAVYAIYATVFLHEWFRTRVGGVAIPGEIHMRELFHFLVMLHATKVTLLSLWDPLFMKFFGFPSRIVIMDIVYQHATRPGAGYLQYALALIAALLILHAVRFRRDNTLVSVVLGCALLSFVYLISLGRTISAPPDYVQSQSHYWYFPNLIGAIILALLLVEKSSLSRRSGIMILAGVMIVGALNSSRIYHQTTVITDGMAELRSYIHTVDDFRRSHSGDKNLKIYVNFPTIQENQEFNLGADIALDIYFDKANIITHDVCKANYVYYKNLGIVPNNLCPDRQHPSSDFTVEFTPWLYVPRYPKEFTVAGQLDGPWAVGFDQNSHLFVDLSRRGPDGLERKRIVVNTELSHTEAQHVIVEAEHDRLYIVINDRLVEIDRLDGFTATPPRNRLDILGDYYTGAEVVFNNAGLHVVFGRAQYDFSHLKPGEKTGIVWSQPWSLAPINYYR